MDYYQHLLQPVSGGAPCGENLEYDPAFLLLQAKLQPRLGAEYGEFVEVTDPVNWAEVERDCHALLAKSRDIRLLVTLMRCRLRVVGLSALAEGLQALLALLQQWPDDLYPQLLDEGEFEPLLRANALNELEDAYGLINDLRQHALPRAVGMQCAIRDLEKAFAIPRDENALPEATVRAMQNEWREKGYAEMVAVGVAQSTLIALSSTLCQSLGDAAPVFSKLKQILDLFTGAVPPCVETPASESKEDALPQAVAETATVQGVPETAVPQVQAVVHNPDIASRAQALAWLKEVQAWFVAAEPGSPIILLLEFAIKTSGKSFTELMQLLPVEIVSHLNNAGKE
ncbi:MULTISPECIES: type VI secretion system protein TssA [Enterobacterales]|uniref:type VI secretion system protein TssA n=1 Tax=Enterobacterales TaxID=91347 RepID=UPI002EDB2AC6